jgi:hypothetical protein
LTDVRWIFRPAKPLLVVLPMIPGFVLGMILGKAFVEIPARCLLPAPQHAAAVIPTIPFDPSYATRLEVSPLSRAGAPPCGCVAL